MDFVKCTADQLGLSSTILFDQVQEEIEGWVRIPLTNMPQIGEFAEHSLTHNNHVKRWHGCHIIWALLYIKNGHPGLGTFFFFLKTNYGSVYTKIQIL